MELIVLVMKYDKLVQQLTMELLTSLPVIQHNTNLVGEQFFTTRLVGILDHLHFIMGIIPQQRLLQIQE
jgi:hypothetical protein